MGTIAPIHISEIENNPMLIDSIKKLYSEPKQVVEEPQVYKPQILPKSEVKKRALNFSNSSVEDKKEKEYWKSEIIRILIIVKRKNPFF